MSMTEPLEVVDGRASDRTSAAGAAAATLRRITKSFYGTPAVRGVDLDVRAGEVHALLGENGAGKSTLCSVLAGLYRPDSGEVLVDGRPCAFRSPHDALDAGVGMVYQHYRLVKTLTVAENLTLGRKDTPRRLSRRVLEERAAELSSRHGIPVDPRACVGRLSVGEQQRVEILKLLGRGVRVLILDEPTAVLTPQEAERLFAAIRALSAGGTSVVLVTHKLGEILAVADRVTVLCDGARVGSVPTAATDPVALARMMVARDASASAEDVLAEAAPVRAARREVATGPVELAVAGLRVAGEGGRDAVDGVDLEIRRGEIVGIAGVSGNGQRELADAIAGLRTPHAGRVTLGGRDVTQASVRERIAAGLGYVPEDRFARGVASGLTLEDNLILRHYWQRRFRRGPFLARGALNRWVAERRARVEVKGARAGLRVSILSGGNVQRAILARELGEDTAALIACSPTRGLDVGVTATVHRLLREQRDRGLAVLLASEDLEEVLALSDRVVVMYEGQIVGEVDAASADPERIGLMMAGSRSVA